MRIFHTLANLFHIWLSRRLTTGNNLVKYGSLIMLAGFGLPAFTITYNSISGDETKLDFSDTSVSDISSLALMVGVCLILIGIIFIIFERYKGEAAPRNRAKSIDLRSLKGAKAPKLCDIFTSTIDQAGLYEQLYLENDIFEESGAKQPSEFLPITARKLTDFSILFLKKTREEEPLKPLALGAIAHIPYCFAMGFLIGNKSSVNYYCWKRDQENTKRTKWIDCRDKLDLGQSANFDTTINTHLKDTDVKHLGMSIEISIKSDDELFIKQNQLDACCKITVPQQRIGNVFSDVEQIRIINQIIDYFNNDLSKRFINLSVLHISISAQASFVMRFGAQLNQNHIPQIKIYHFENRHYPWYLILNNGSDEVGWGQSAIKVTK